MAANPFDDPPSTMDIEKAVRDTVTVRGHRIGRSQTQQNSPAPQAKPSAPSPRRSQSQDSAPKPPPKSSKKKGSQHADVIDRLDYSGVGGPMFHHDGPFDACAPSRNRHRNKAPMAAWSQDPNQVVDLHSGDSPYPAPNAAAYNGFSESYYEPPKKKVDVLAEAWGIHEPEPFEEFSAGGGARGGTPASSIYNGKESNKGSKRSSRDGRDHREVYREYLEDPQSRVNRNPRRGTIPPPQPIFVPDPTTPTGDQPIISSSPGSAGFPKRSKSLMQRIRKMRDAPNVPVGSDYDESPSSPNFPPSPNPNGERERPTHRSQNSFLGRFGNSRSPPPQEAPLSEPYVFIDPTTNSRDKDLPPAPVTSTTPKEAASTGYFDPSNGSTGVSPGGGLGRKTSIMKKVGRVVRGQR